MTRAASLTRSFCDPADTITLDQAGRHRRRMAMRSDGRDGSEGIDFLLDLAEPRLLSHGDGLVLDDGRVIEVRAAPEPLLEVRGRDGAHLAALAWQLGNRHTPCQLDGDRLLIRRDHVLEDMLRKRGATVRHVDEPFQPEGGAYGDGASHAHHHGHDHE